MTVREILQQYGIRPSKGLGQNFLVAEWVYERILAASRPAEDDLVLEIGAGVGRLTERLADRAGCVVAVELDDTLVKILRERLAGRENVRIVQGDILELAVEDLVRQEASPSSSVHVGYKVVANLPYYVTSAILRHLLMSGVRPETMTVMVQHEVAQRIAAKVGDLSLLALSVQVFGRPEIVCRVPANAFYPQPTVNSAVLQIDLYAEPLIAEERLSLFFRVARAAFQQRRKQVHNSLTHGLPLTKEQVQAALETAGIDIRRRPQAIPLGQWNRLVEALATFLDADA